MNFICRICNDSFSKNANLNRHLDEDRCKVAKKMTTRNVNDRFEEYEKKLDELRKNATIISGNHSDGGPIGINTFNNTYNINIEINPIQKLSLDYVVLDEMKNLIDKYDNDLSQRSLNLLIGNYLNIILCNEEHPENHAVTYIKKYPPTFDSVYEKGGKIVHIVSDLQKTCDILVNPILDLLKKKLNEFMTTYRSNGRDYFDYQCYKQTIEELRKELNKENVKKVLNSFLKNNVLNNIQMKLDIEKIPKTKEQIAQEIKTVQETAATQKLNKKEKDEEKEEKEEREREKEKEKLKQEIKELKVKEANKIKQEKKDEKEKKKIEKENQEAQEARITKEQDEIIARITQEQLAKIL
jgi:hypothetical protein